MDLLSSSFWLGNFFGKKKAKECSVYFYYLLPHGVTCRKPLSFHESVLPSLRPDAVPSDCIFQCLLKDWHQEVLRRVRIESHTAAALGPVPVERTPPAARGFESEPEW